MKAAQHESDPALELARKIVREVIDQLSFRRICLAENKLVQECDWLAYEIASDTRADSVAALLRPQLYYTELFGRAMMILKGLSLAVDWELSPDVKKEIGAICAEFEVALPSVPLGETGEKL